MIGDGKVGTIQKIKATNVPKLKDDVTLALRAITEKRATTLTYMIDKAKENDEFAKEAIHQYGLDNGKDFKGTFINADDIKEFTERFTAGLEPHVYEMETVDQTDKSVTIHFHYCPYVNRWLRMGKTPKEMSRLCDLCMEGDKATASIFDHINFELGDTIAKGGDYCELKYTRV